MNLRVQQIVKQLHGNKRCTKHYPERLTGMISNFISNVRHKQHGTGSKVTRAQLHSILSRFPRESSDDDTLILLGHAYQTPKKMCMVLSTLRWLRNAYLQAIEAERSGLAVWLAIYGTGEAICEKNHILLMCTLTVSHGVAILGITVAGSETKFSVCYFCKTMRKKVEALFRGWKWLLQYVTSDGAPAMGGSAHKVCPTLEAWLQCVYHVFRNFRRALFQSLPGPAFENECPALHRCLHTKRCTWSPRVKNAGWNALTNRPSTRPEHLAHIREQYVDQRSNWAVGDSLADIPATTTSEPHANMLKVVTDHRWSTLVEFLQVTLPKIAKQWTSRPFAISRCAPQPEPRMWQYSQALHMANAFFNDGDALFFDQGDFSKKRSRLKRTTR